MKIVLEHERPVSWNMAYAGRHWSKRKADADAVHLLVRAAIPRNARQYSEPVDIVVTAYFASRPLDADNIMAKLYIDGLVGRLLVDDNPKWVRSVKTVSLVDRRRPRVEIDIEPAKG